MHNHDCANDYDHISGITYDISSHKGSNSTRSILSRLFGQERNNRHPYGVDAVFLPTSTLYDGRLSPDISQYYNTTSESEEVAPTGAPYAFYHRALKWGDQAHITSCARFTCA
ncbi:hypothetical protein VOLCADRAFT_107238 [Volvox carteri f. nagariensis]|uniref:Uncharacterized protein n=1 Tax=Volvox carteri f. nagariensis TaxID=3068 RepID=D8UCS9_VOLCA|nr:uncharacterized protein VOLCADRAFT_107238 [Volvox carteri f. nagariensis]EFJ42396.1 hypothetical protein VOLCADRAFT_107238 [Volvox carteri f. nagariensis]|eukprot:XP_002956459.1 hypothetical protein VOLCADRAFT_107238 [Volvox carteri f. nagariensis]